MATRFSYPGVVRSVSVPIFSLIEILKVALSGTIRTIDKGEGNHVTVGVVGIENTIGFIVSGAIAKPRGPIKGLVRRKCAAGDQRRNLNLKGVESVHGRGKGLFISCGCRRSVFITAVAIRRGRKWSYFARFSCTGAAPSDYFHSDDA